MSSEVNQVAGNGNANPFKKAERSQAWLKLGLTGPSGSGKTYSALAIASGMAKRIALIDTENRSASLYSDRFEFDILELEPPYEVEKYITAIKAAVEAGYEVLIIDSISHAWAGQGGLLQQKEELDARGASGNARNKNQFSNWAPITKKQEQFMSWILNSDIHLIVTMRSKQEYVIAEGGQIRKLGLQPIQRDGAEYELATVLDIAMNHKAVASKDRTSLFSHDTPMDLGPELGRRLIAWLSQGKPPAKREVPESLVPGIPISVEEVEAMYNYAERFGWAKTDVMAALSKKGMQSLSELKVDQAEKFRQFIHDHPKRAAVREASVAH